MAVINKYYAIIIFKYYKHNLMGKKKMKKDYLF